MPFSEADKLRRIHNHTQTHISSFFFLSPTLLSTFEVVTRPLLLVCSFSMNFRYFFFLYFTSPKNIYIWSKSFHVYLTDCHSFSKYNIRICLTIPITCLRIFINTQWLSIFRFEGKKNPQTIHNEFRKSKKASNFAIGNKPKYSRFDFITYTHTQKSVKIKMKNKNIIADRNIQPYLNVKHISFKIECVCQLQCFTNCTTYYYCCCCCRCSWFFFYCMFHWCLFVDFTVCKLRM